ncbi:MFS transporter [Rhodococcus sp. IEGM 1330]|uniref:MFS transporter n=1 Tax=Rhodococcus sp. IEGM 1330 TaxID=3082225 RepID=UPI002952A70C|nr:MFS transporter [Rhodococcus sp. IEGM 1330]MDV8022642.1 MFS transporter [Rhodococcus sp. IEGM 1330]
MPLMVRAGLPGRRLMLGVIRAAWKIADLRVLMISTLVVALSSNLVLPYLAVYLSEEQGVSAGGIAAVIAIRFWSQQGLATVGGIVADRWGAPLGCRLGLALRVVAYTLFAFSGGLVAAAVAAALLGLGGALYIPSSKVYLASAAVTELSPRELYPLRSMLNNVGNAAGPLLGTAALLVDVRIVFIAAAIAVTAVVLSLRSLRPYSRTERSRINIAGYTELLTTRRLWAPLIGMLCFGLVYIQIEYSIPLMVTERTGGAFVGILFFLNAVFVVIWQLFVSTRVARVPPMLVVVAGLVVMAVGIAVGQSGAVAAVVVMVALFSLGEALVEPSIDSEVTAVVADGLRGPAFGLSGLFMSIGAIAGTSAAAAVVHSGNNFLLIAGICAVGVPVAALAALVFKPPVSRSRIGTG